jgi:nicotinate phosphoribosyltransferase
LRWEISPQSEYEDLLVPIFRGGRRVYEVPSIKEARAFAQRQLEALPSGARRFENPHRYPVGLSGALHARKEAMVLAARAATPVN